MYRIKRIEAIFAVIFALVYVSLTFGTASAMLSSYLPLTMTDGKLSEPDLKKNIVLEDGSVVSGTSMNAGDTVNFLLESNVPENLIDYLPPHLSSPGRYDLIFYDKMDAELIFHPESLCVRVNSHELPENEYKYEFQVIDDYSLIRIEIELVELFTEHHYFDYEEFGIAPITLEYSATLTETVTSGAYHNAAWLEYENNITPEQVTTINTYGIEIHKKTNDIYPSALAGAEFEVYQIVNGRNEVLFENLVTDANGIIRIDGLEAGVYYIKETKAPEGFVMNSEPFEIILDESLDGQLAIVGITNARITPPVYTGGASRYIIGCTFVFAGIVAFIYMLLKKHSISEG